MFFAIAFVVGCILMPVVRRVGPALGVIDRPDPGSLKIHPEPVTLLGGAGVTIAALATFLIASPGRTSPGNVVAVMAATVCALVVGLVDDVRPLAPPTRLVAIAIAGVLASEALPTVDPLALRLALTVTLALACANAVNLVDGQDMLAGGLAGIAALGMATAAAVLDLPALVWTVGVSLAGALTAFLIWNRPPARVFLGSCGAYGAGLLLAIQAAVLIAVEGWVGFVVVSCCLAVPAFEVCSTVVRRTVSGAPLAGGDRAHTYDLLSARYASRAGATLRLCALQFAFVALGVAAAAFPVPGIAIAVGVEAAGAVVGSVLVMRALHVGAPPAPGEVIG